MRRPLSSRSTPPDRSLRSLWKVNSPVPGGYAIMNIARGLVMPSSFRTPRTALTNGGGRLLQSRCSPRCDAGVHSSPTSIGAMVSIVSCVRTGALKTNKSSGSTILHSSRA